MPQNEYICDCDMIHSEAVNKVLSKMPDRNVFDKVSMFFSISSNSTRLKIIWSLDEAELCVCDIANILSMTKSAVSHQLKILRDAKLVKFRREGKSVYYSLADDHVKQMLEAAMQHIHD